MKKLKKIFKRVIVRINSINKTLLNILIISLISIIIMDLYLKKIQAPFEPIYVLGNLYYNVCLVYCTSFIFYIVTVYIPQERKKLSLYKYINNRIWQIDELKINLLNSIMSGCSYNENNIRSICTLTEDELNKCCCKTNPNNLALVKFPYGSYRFENWFKAFDYFHSEFKKYISDLLIFEDCLNNELISMLADIDDLFENYINNTKGYPLANETMEFYSRYIWRLHITCENLMKTFKDYTLLISEKYHKNFRKKNLKESKNK